jgi:hypothetical protein
VELVPSNGASRKSLRILLGEKLPVNVRLDDLGDNGDLYAIVEQNLLLLADLGKDSRATLLDSFGVEVEERASLNELVELGDESPSDFPFALGNL